MTEGKCDSRLDKIEETCIASHIEVGVTSGGELLDVVGGSGTSTKEVVVIGSDTGI